MPRYFFQARYRGATVIDDVGEEFSTLQEAETHAALVAGELARNETKPVAVSVLSQNQLSVATTATDG